MLDIKFIEENPQLVTDGARQKNVDLDVNELLKLNDSRKKLQQTVETLHTKRKDLSTKSRPGQPSAAAIAQGREIKDQLKSTEARFKEVDQQYNRLMLTIPNLPSADTPIGPDASANKVLRQIGERPRFNFKPQEHWQLGQKLGVINTKTAARVAGTRFAYLTGKLALLQFALIQYALSLATDSKKIAAIIRDAKLDVPTVPFTPVIPPVMIKKDVFSKMARLEPKDDKYFLQNDDLYLIGSAEHTLGSLHMNETIAARDLPQRYIGYSTSFRREAGSYGKDVKGILRVHQFDKLEIVSFTLPEKSQDEQNFIVALQENLMQKLDLPYQVVQVSSGDQGTPTSRQIDIETWLPGQATYRETHTSDLNTDYQARRLKTRFKKETGESGFVHMNDATVFAIGRTLIAIMENYQQADGTIKIPKALKPYLSFKLID